MQWNPIYTTYDDDDDDDDNDDDDDDDDEVIFASINKLKSGHSTRGGYSSEFLVGVCCPGLQIPTLFQT